MYWGKIYGRSRVAMKATRRSTSEGVRVVPRTKKPTKNQQSSIRARHGSLERNAEGGKAKAETLAGSSV